MPAYPLLEREWITESALCRPLEERLPALYMIFPNHHNTSVGNTKRLLTNERAMNLESNTRKIVNGLDVFETVMDLVGTAVRRSWAYRYIPLEQTLPTVSLTMLALLLVISV